MVVSRVCVKWLEKFHRHGLGDGAKIDLFFLGRGGKEGEGRGSDPEVSKTGPSSIGTSPVFLCLLVVWGCAV